MKKIALSLITVLSTCTAIFSQSKVFKQVNDQISTQVSPIWQDKAVIGYMAFTRLETVSDVLYNYKITIMDENLNDVGSVSFRDELLSLQGTAFEQDVLCIAYFKSPVLNQHRFSNTQQFQEARDKSRNAIKMHFLGLDGKIIDSVDTPLSLDIQSSRESGWTYAKGGLTHNVKLINVPNHGFACLFGDSKKTVLSLFDHTGKRNWQRVIKEDPVAHLQLLVSGNDIYVVTEGAGNKEVKKHYQPNSYEVLSFNITDSTAYPKIGIKDKKEHQMVIHNFENDPASGKPYLSGVLKSSSKRAHAKSVNGISRGHYAGLFSYNVMSPNKKDVKEQFTYWDDASNSQLSSKGFAESTHSYPRFHSSFRDFEGNTYFIADGIVRYFSAMRTAANLLWIPTIPLNPMGVLTVGTRKGRLGNPLLLKQDKNGAVTASSMFEGAKYSGWYSNIAISELGKRTYYTATNHDQKQQFVVVTEYSTTSIYNVATQKQVRTVPLKDKNISRAVIPAKEGHILISEYDSKEKTTRVSIEAL